MASLPLFPLQTLLFPGISMPMQIFEPRYVELISDCMKHDHGFGIVAIKSGREVGMTPEIYPVGVEVQIIDWYQQENNLLGIRVQAERKIRVNSAAPREDRLLIGDIDYLPTEPSVPLNVLGDELAVLAEELKQHPALAELELPSITDARTLGWQLAQLLPIEQAEKVRLLELSDPQQRVDDIARWVDRNAD